VSQSKVDVAVARGQFTNPEEIKRAPLDTVARILMKIVIKEISVCVSVCVCVCV
jgi:hypothetical protein